MRLLLALACVGCGADMMNNEALHAHVDDVVRTERAPEHADRFLLNAGVLVPVLGSYRLDHQVYGDVRPSAIVFDWILGGLVPAALVATSFGVSGATARRALRWTALGLYASTRVGIFVIGNLHITEYDDYLDSRLVVRGAAVGATF